MAALRALAHKLTRPADSWEAAPLLAFRPRGW